MENLWKALALAWHNLELVTVLRWIFGGGGAGTFIYLCKKIPVWYKKIRLGMGLADRVELMEADSKLQAKQILEQKQYFENLLEVMADRYDATLYVYQAQFMASIHTSGEPICLLDAERNMIYANPAYLFMTGGQLSDVLGTGYMDLIAPEQRDRIATVRLDLLKNPRSKEGFVTFQNKLTREFTDTIYRTEPVHEKPKKGQTVGDVNMIIGRFKIVKSYMPK